MIVGHPAVGIYQGKNDADAAYLERLRGDDDGERDCSGAPDMPRSGGGSDGAGDVDVPDTDGALTDGALTDGYCARTWWC